jgi:hypothetical protein
VQVLVNRLKNRVSTSVKDVIVYWAEFTPQLPFYSGVSLDHLEADSAIQQAIEALVELSHDSLDIIAWALSELLDRLAKVRPYYASPNICFTDPESSKPTARDS